MEDRTKELQKIVYAADPDNRIKATQLIDEIVFIEDRMTELRKLPFISVNPNNPAQQKSTPAAKLYKELLQQYNNSLKLLFRLCGERESEEESPLRQWVKSRGGISE